MAPPLQVQALNGRHRSSLRRSFRLGWQRSFHKARAEGQLLAHLCLPGSLDSGDQEHHTQRRVAVLSAALLGFFASWRPLKLRVARALGAPVTMPLEWRDDAFHLHYCVGDGASKRCFWATADTGSPFLLVPRCLRKDCARYCKRWGCYSGQGKPSGMPDTYEGFASGLVEVQWRKGASLSFPDGTSERGAPATLSNLNFGVQGRTISMGGTSKSVFFGLVREHMLDIKPSFLEQTDFYSLGVDLRQVGRETLTLSPSRLVSAREEYLQLVDPTQWGDPIRHYAAIATSVRVGGVLLSASSSRGDAEGDEPRRVLCVFDTGTTGTSMTRSMHDEYWNITRQLAATGVKVSEARRMEVSFEMSSGRDLNLGMFMGRHPAYGSGLDQVSPVDELCWAGVGPPASLARYRVPGGVANRERPFEDVVFLGLGFLMGRRLAIDTESGRLSISRLPEA